MSATSYQTILPNVERDCSAPPLCCCCRSPPRRPGAGPAARRSFRHPLLRYRPGHRWPPHDRHQRHGRQHPRSARPGQPPQGQHWINEPQRAPITAGEIGQVFGVAFDDATPPNIYVTATAAFGLHRTGDNAQWMPGMFGRRRSRRDLPARRGERLQADAVLRLTLNGRKNSGAALGNIAYDRWNKQFLVSDLETGMIHRFGLEGRDLGSFDHGTQGRTSFVDAQSGQSKSLKPIGFNPSSSANIANCQDKFDNTPDCWNIAESGRRVWGLGVWKGPNGETRLYYSVAIEPGSRRLRLERAAGRREAQHALVGAARSGRFVRSEPACGANPCCRISSPIRRTSRARAIAVRLPTSPSRPARAGRSCWSPSAAACAISASAGITRSPRRTKRAPSATSSTRPARGARWAVTTSATMTARGRRALHQRELRRRRHLRSGLFGRRPATGPADGFVWISGDKLCSPEGPCNAPASQQVQAQQVSMRGGAQSEYQPDDSEVHGAQGQPEDVYNALVPPSANAENAGTVNPVGPGQAYMVDIDVNIDASGNPIEVRTRRTTRP